MLWIRKKKKKRGSVQILKEEGSPAEVTPILKEEGALMEGEINFPNTVIRLAKEDLHAVVEGMGRTSKKTMTVGAMATGTMVTGVIAIGAMATGMMVTGVIATGAMATGMMVTGVIAIGAMATGMMVTGVIATGAMAIGTMTAGRDGNRYDDSRRDGNRNGGRDHLRTRGYGRSSRNFDKDEQGLKTESGREENSTNENSPEGNGYTQRKNYSNKSWSKTRSRRPYDGTNSRDSLNRDSLNRDSFNRDSFNRDSSNRNRPNRDRFRSDQEGARGRDFTSRDFSQTTNPLSDGPASHSVDLVHEQTKIYEQQETKFRSRDGKQFFEKVNENEEESDIIYAEKPVELTSRSYGRGPDERGPDGRGPDGRGSDRRGSDRKHGKRYPNRPGREQLGRSSVYRKRMDSSVRKFQDQEGISYVKRQRNEEESRSYIAREEDDSFIEKKETTLVSLLGGQSKNATSDLTFEKLGISSEMLLNNLKMVGVDMAMPVQEKVTPLVLRGENIVCSSPTGSGKTLAFAAPIVDLHIRGSAYQVVVLSPTREIALQSKKVFDSLFQDKSANKVGLVIGGTDMNEQKQILRHYPPILIATPGRLLDMYKQGLIWLDYTNIFVLDEMDRMV